MQEDYNLCIHIYPYKGTHKQTDVPYQVQQVTHEAEQDNTFFLVKRKLNKDNTLLEAKK